MEEADPAAFRRQNLFYLSGAIIHPNEPKLREFRTGATKANEQETHASLRLYLRMNNGAVMSAG